MVTCLFTNHDCLKHKTPPSHPENAERIKIILKSIEDNSFKKLIIKNCKTGKMKDITRVHSKEHIKSLLNKNFNNYFKIDEDTFFSQNSKKAILGCVGAVKKAVDHVLKEKINNAFCAIRPPGHHASKNSSMGFCIINNLAIGVCYALDKYKLNRIAIIDFDVHHGNGTQNIFWNEKKVLFISSHQVPLFPGSGKKEETGKYGNIFNFELKPGTDGKSFIKILSKKIIPIVEKFNPELIFLSSGFDAHEKDQLSNMNFKTNDYGEITELILKLANKVCNGKLISCLEGGYQIEALSECIKLHLNKLMEA